MAVGEKRLNVAGNGPCSTCGRQMRPSNRSIADNPGTIAHHGHGVCVSCTKRAQRKAAGKEYRPKRPTHCVGCNRPLRPGKTKPADYPGTVEHRGKGRCQLCTKQQATPDAPKPVIQKLRAPAEPIEGINPAMDAYLRKRRERLARQQRLTQVRRPAA